MTDEKPLPVLSTGCLNGAFNVGFPRIRAAVDLLYCLRRRIYYLDGPAIRILLPCITRMLQVNQ